MAVQRSYDINPARGYPGALARPSEPHALDSGVIHVPANARNPRPGDALYYDEAENAFAIPTSGAQSGLVCAILSYRADQVANAESIVEYSDGDEIQFARLGTFWVRAGAAMEYGQRIAWDRADYEWDPVADPALAANPSIATVNALLEALGRYPIVCVSREPVAASGIAQAQIGYGRVR